MTRIVAHLGAHRTASTSIQDCVAASAATRDDHSLIAYTPKTHKIVPFMIGETSSKVVASSIRSVLDYEPKFDLFFLSHENFLGDFVAAFNRNAFYPKPAAEFVKIRHLLPAEIEILLTVRAYSTWYASVFAYRYGRRIFEEFDGFRAEILNRDRGWYDVVSELDQAFPDAKIVVANFERYTTDFSSLGGYLGLSQEEIVAFPRTNPSPGAETVLKVQEKISLGEDPMQINARQATNNKIHGFRPWSPDERALLDEKYRDDLTRIRTELKVQTDFADI